MVKAVKYTQGNEMTLYVPLVLLDNDGKQEVDVDLITDAEVNITCKGVKTTLTPVFIEDYMTVSLAATLAAGMYVIDWKFKYDGRKVAGRRDYALEIVNEDEQSNWGDLISDGTAQLECIFIAGNVMTDAEFEAIKAEYRVKTAAAEAAKAAYIAAKAAADAVAYTAVSGLSEAALTQIITTAVNAAMAGASVSVNLTPVTSRLDNTTYGLEAIKTAVDSKVVPTNYAKETTAAAAKTAAQAAKTAAEAIVIPTDYAKATDIPTDYAKASELGQLRQECDKIGSPASGQPSTLFAAIAAGGSGGGGSSAEVIAKLNTIIANEDTLITKRNAFGTYVFSDDHIADSVTEILYNRTKLKSVTEQNVENIEIGYSFYGCTKLQSVSFPNLKTITGAYTLYGCTELNSINMPVLESISALYVFNGCTALRSISFPNLKTITAGYVFANCTTLNQVNLPNLTNFGSMAGFNSCYALESISIPKLKTISTDRVFGVCNNLIDITFGENLTASINIATWSPTVVLNDVNKKAQMLKNIREHIAANLPTITSNYSITFSSAVKAAILADTETTAAFTNKGWTIA